MKVGIEFINMDREELNQLVERAGSALSAEEQRKLKGVVEALSYLTDLVADQRTTIRDLRELLFPDSTEKTAAVLKNAGMERSTKPDQPAGERKQKQPGHGRNGAEDYRNPRRVKIQHASLKSGDHCPGCLKGKVYEQKEPRQLVRVVGQAPLAATIYDLQCLRCNLCGEVYSAEAPEGIGEDKYDESAAAMIADHRPQHPSGSCRKDSFSGSKLLFSVPAPRYCCPGERPVLAKTKSALASGSACSGWLCPGRNSAPLCFPSIGHPTISANHP